MIPHRLIEYLKTNGISYTHQRHRFAITAQQAAQSAHVSGYRLAKCVVCEADGDPLLAVIPAAGQVDVRRLQEVLGARQLRLLSEGEFASRFPDCEAGAEPPFGKLFGMPVVMDESLRGHDRLAFRAGVHDELIELDTADFEQLEGPLVGTFAYQPEKHWYIAQHDIAAPM